MILKGLRFLKTGTSPEHYPEGELPEVVFLGRSNAGKSSAINALSLQDLAKVSSKPGKTRALQFFEVPKRFRFVDVPGYGWSSRSADEMETWQQMIETYLQTRTCLKACILVSDARRQDANLDDMMMDFLQRSERPWARLFTKSDLLKKAELLKMQRSEREEPLVFWASSREPRSFDPVGRWILHQLEGKK